MISGVTRTCMHLRVRVHARYNLGYFRISAVKEYDFSGVQAVSLTPSGNLFLFIDYIETPSGGRFCYLKKAGKEMIEKTIIQKR